MIKIPPEQIINESIILFIFMIEMTNRNATHIDILRQARWYTILYILMKIIMIHIENYIFISITKLPYILYLGYLDYFGLF